MSHLLLLPGIAQNCHIIAISLMNDYYYIVIVLINAHEWFIMKLRVLTIRMEKVNYFKP